MAKNNYLDITAYVFAIYICLFFRARQDNQEINRWNTWDFLLIIKKAGY